MCTIILYPLLGFMHPRYLDSRLSNFHKCHVLLNFQSFTNLWMHCSWIVMVKPHSIFFVCSHTHGGDMKLNDAVISCPWQAYIHTKTTSGWVGFNQNKYIKRCLIHLEIWILLNMYILFVGPIMSCSWGVYCLFLLISKGVHPKENYFIFEGATFN